MRSGCATHAHTLRPKVCRDSHVHRHTCIGCRRSTMCIGCSRSTTCLLELAFRTHSGATRGTEPVGRQAVHRWVPWAGRQRMAGSPGQAGSAWMGLVVQATSDRRGGRSECISCDVKGDYFQVRSRPLRFVFGSTLQVCILWRPRGNASVETFRDMSPRARWFMRVTTL